MIQAAPGLAYLRTFPDFESGNVTASAAFGLQRILALLEEIGSPHLQLTVLHLAGTKGKGSTAAMLASILRAAGYRTGLFTQPHLVRVHERFALDGVLISDSELDDIMLGTLRPAIERLALRGIAGVQQFEAQVALALSWFAARGAEAVVLETGLGGRLDGTNVSPRPLVTVITPIGLDHTQVLGSTLSAIAAEKAAIIKRHRPVVVSPQQPGPLAVIERAAQEAQALLLLGQRDWQVKACRTTLSGTLFNFSFGTADLIVQGQETAVPLGVWRDSTLTLPDLWTPLLGRHQAMNAGAAVTAALVARRQLGNVNERAIRQGLASVHWPGRLQILTTSPLLLVDGAHTPESAAALRQALEDLLPGRRCVLVCGMQADKDIGAFLAPLSAVADSAVATKADHPRAAPVETMVMALRAAGFSTIEAAANPPAAVACARTLLKPSDVIVATGSLHIVGDLLAAREHDLVEGKEC